MWKIKATVLVVFLIVGLDAAATKEKTATKHKDSKEKRESLTGAPYSYETPQKSFQSPIRVQPQPKVTSVTIEHRQQPSSAHHQQQASSHHQQQAPSHLQQQAPLSHQQQAPSHHQQQASLAHHYQQEALQQQAQAAALQKVAPLEYSSKQQQEAGPVQFTSKNEAPAQPQEAEHESMQYHPTTFQFNPEIENLLKGYDDFSYSYPNFESFNKVPIVHYNGEYDKVNSALVAVPEYTYKSAQEYAYKEAPTYSYKASPQYVFKAAPEQTYAKASSEYAYKTAPIYSSVKSVPSYSYAPATSYNFPANSYSFPHSYVASYAPASSHHYSHAAISQQPSALFIPQAISVASNKPSKIPDYAIGSKGLSHYSTVSAPASSHSSNSYVPKATYEAPSYIHLSQTERPFKPSAFLGASHDSYTEQSIANAKPSNEYLQPSKSYLPAKEQHYQYAQSVAPVEYQIQYVQQPAKAYLPPVANNYLPPQKVAVEAPKNTYIPSPQVPAKTYLPSKAVEKPENTYLPPSAPYQQSSHHQQQQQPQQQHYQSVPQHHHQQQQQQQQHYQSEPEQSQYQSHDAYESAAYEYQVVTSQSQSGHK